MPISGRQCSRQGDQQGAFLVHSERAKRGKGGHRMMDSGESGR